MPDQSHAGADGPRQPSAPSPRLAPALAKAVAVARLLLGTARDLLPLVLVVGFFQIAVLQRPFPNLEATVVGLLLVVVGLALFMRGLEMALFPIGETMAEAFARRGSLLWLLLFAFALGFGTTVAEPALIAIAGEAARTAAEAGTVAREPSALANYASGLRFTVAGAVGAALVLGVFRILKGWPIHWMIMGGYLIVVALTALAPGEIVGIAYDSGGVTTSTVTVPLVTALGVGLATVIKGRNPMIDGFGLIALASLTPIIFVLIYGMVV